MRVRTMVAVAAWLAVAALPAPPARALGLGDVLKAAVVDSQINHAFDVVLKRSPSDRELRRYRALMEEDHWTEQDVQDDLRGRNDYRRYPRESSSDVDRVVRRAYEDILHREPDTEGLRTYRSRMLDDGWTESEVREALRKSGEHGQVSRESAERIVKRAYQDILGRDPDYSGLVAYRNKILDQGWDEHDVREALRKSPEYRQKTAMTPQQAEQVVRRAYLSVLNREPDAGSRGYVDRVLRDHWTEQDVARELRNSQEYRSKR